ncbi:D-2-hydroxyacid dehydrogenase [Bacillus massilinigeriensis]|uniref:D-2-hydroxyacid dehydrogenase n=1 Tax=Bacillus mediterraneensis TaxID=1805474 RepID=UPI000AD0E6F7
MKISFSLLPNETLQKEITEAFPDDSFYFSKGISEEFYESEVFVTYGEDLTPEHIENAAKLKWIMVMSAGLEKMPFQACRDKGIIVTNSKGVFRIPMAEYTLGVMLQHVKAAEQLRKNAAEGKWDRKVRMGELYGKTVLILGAGAIGGEIARLAKAFGMKTVGVNRSGRSVDYIDRITTMENHVKFMADADFVVSVLPSTPETKYLLSEFSLQKMKREAVFINIGRGDVVQEEILLKALEEKRFIHAYLDVFEKEPLPKDHPLWRMENVTVTPHLSGIT